MMSFDKHILIAYTYSLNNIGDISNTSGLVHLVNGTLPGMPVEVITSQVAGSPDYEVVERYYAKNKKNCSTLANPFKIHCGVPRFGDEATPWGRFCNRWGEHKMDAFLKGCLASDLAAAMADDLLEAFTGEVIADFRENNPAALRAFENAAFYIYSSGTVLNFGRLQIRDFWTYALHWALPLMVSRKMGIPYGINAHSFDATDWPGDLVVRPLLKDAEFVYSRDSDSANYLRQRDLHNAEDGYRPDTSFFFSVRDAGWARDFMEAKDLEDRNFLVLITRHATAAVGKETEWDKVGGDPTAGSVSMERQEEQMRKLRAFVEAWTKKTGIPILMALETRATQVPMRRWLDRELSAEARRSVVWLEEFWASEAAFSVYEHARIIISMEMHSVIMGIKAHTPVVHIPFRECGRKARMMHDLGLGDWLLDIDEMKEEDLLNACLSIHSNFEESVNRTCQSTALAERLGVSVIERVKARLNDSARFEEALSPCLADDLA